MVHCNVSEPCPRLWNALAAIELNSLMWVSKAELLSQWRLQPTWPPPPLAYRGRSKFELVLSMLKQAHGAAQRCRPLGGAAAPRDISRHAAVLPPAAAAGSMCGPVDAFNASLAPFKWLPGLAVRRLPPSYYKQRASNSVEASRSFEVMHLTDSFPGPIWL